MLADARAEIVDGDAPTWAPEGKAANDERVGWREVDRALRTLAVRRARLDAEEAYWLREAEAEQIWRPLGMVSAIDYLERVFGYGPRSAGAAPSRACARLVARAVGGARGRAAAVLGGARADARGNASDRGGLAGRRVGQDPAPVEELVAEHRPGDLPGDPPESRVACTWSGSSCRPRRSRRCARRGRCSTTSMASTCPTTSSWRRCAAACLARRRRRTRSRTGRQRMSTRAGRRPRRRTSSRPGPPINRRPGRPINRRAGRPTSGRPGRPINRRAGRWTRGRVTD